MKKVLSVVLSLILLIGLCGCGGGTSSTVYIALDEVSTLDPQLVKNSTDRNVVLNIYEGLIKLDHNDTPILAAADSYEQQGLEYTFTLREDNFWSDGTPLTAYDFQFAFRRAASPDTNAPDFAKISCIKGARAVKNGAAKENLAVYAVDDRTLKITLEHADENFLETLASPICMPCNEKFFKDQNGKYGRQGESVLSNGSFYVYSWNSEKYRIRLKKNPHYEGNFPAESSEIYLTAADSETALTQLVDNDIDLAFISSTLRDEADRKGLNAQSYFDHYLFIFINKQGPLGASSVRRALSLSIHRNALENEMPSYLIPLNAVIQPDALFEGEGIYGELAGSSGLKYLPDEAYSLYLDYTKQASVPRNLSIIYPEEFKIDNLTASVAAGWQQSLGCFINMEAQSSNAAVLSRIKSGDYTVAICALGAGDKNAYDLLTQFRKGNDFGFSNSQYDAVLNSLHAKSGIEAYTAALRDAQKILLADCSILPLAATPTVVCTTSAVTNVNYSIINEYIDFASIKKN